MWGAQSSNSGVRVMGVGAGSRDSHKGRKHLDWGLREEGCEERKRKSLTARGRVTQAGHLHAQKHRRRDEVGTPDSQSGCGQVDRWRPAACACVCEPSCVCPCVCVSPAVCKASRVCVCEVSHVCA